MGERCGVCGGDPMFSPCCGRVDGLSRQVAALMQHALTTAERARGSLKDALEEALRWADESHADPCPVCGVRVVACGCWVAQARSALVSADAP